jgi:type I restriction-modification system DNA methylase subunit
MSNGDLNWIANFIWGIADDALRDLYVRGKYRDVILPMMVLRRLDAVLEPTKAAVLSMKDNLDKAGITNQDAALRQAAGQAFYNTSRFNLRDLRNRASQAQLKADFEAFLDGFSPNVQVILDNFEFRGSCAKSSVFSEEKPHCFALSFSAFGPKADLAGHHDTCEDQFGECGGHHHHQLGGLGSRKSKQGSDHPA